MERLLNALAHDRFISLRNFGDRWELSHWNAQESAVLCDKYLDRLLETWCDLLERQQAEMDANALIAFGPR